VVFAAYQALSGVVTLAFLGGLPGWLVSRRPTGMHDVRRQDADYANTTAHRRTAILVRNTVTEWLMSSPAPDQADPVGTAYASGTFHQGISARILYHEAIRDDADASARARQLSASGAHIRTTWVSLPVMVISDRETALIVTDPADSATTSALIRHPTITATLAALFEQTWSNATPLASGEDRPTSGGLGRIERDLLMLLASGATDEAAARRLGMSLRTARRHVATVMRQLNAASRFQAGVEAARRGWLA
jgi:DNA-binding CsgD family transcriptional regulator